MWAILIPALGAALLPLVPRAAPWLNIAFAAATLLAVLLPEPGGAGWLRLDALNHPLVVVAGIIGLATAVFSAHERLSHSRLYHAAFQGFCAANMLALLSDNLGLMWVAIEAATLASVVMVASPRSTAALEAAWKFFILCGVGIALALFGTVVLQMAVPGAGLSFAALRAGAASADPGLLNLAFILLLVGYGTKSGLVPLHHWLPDAHAEGPLPITAVLSGLLLTTAMHAVLRAKAVVGAHAGTIPPGAFLLVLGGATLLVAAFALWRRRDARRLFAWSSIKHMGVAAIAFGLGGPAANLAGLLHLLGHALVKSAVFIGLGAAVQLKGSQRVADIGGLVASHPALGWGLGLAVLGASGLPPFMLFASEFLLLTSAGRQAPWLLLPLLLGLLVGAAALVRTAQRLCLGPATADVAGAPAPGLLVLIPLWGLLLLAFWAMLAMPAPIAAMLRAAAEVPG